VLSIRVGEGVVKGLYEEFAHGLTSLRRRLAVFLYLYYTNVYTVSTRKINNVTKIEESPTMSLIETLTIDVGTSIATLLLRLWLKDGGIAQNVTFSSVSDIAKTQTSDMRSQRQAVRQFEAIGEKVGESLLPLFTSSETSLTEDDKVDVALAVKSTLDNITGEILTQNYLSPSNLTRALLTAYPSTKYTFDELKSTLYRHVVSELCEYVVDIASQLPVITNEQTFVDILKRETQILARAERLLQETQREREQLSYGKQNSTPEEGVKLEFLKFVGVEPLRQAEMFLESRLNLITGDNALGKTFILDCAWWVLTGNWASAYPIVPRQDTLEPQPSIGFRLGRKTNTNKVKTWTYDFKKEEWLPPTRKSALPGLSIYAQADGTFTIWDPAKALLAEENPFFTKEASYAFLRFSQKDFLNGIQEDNQGHTRVLCNGLIQDWVYWQNDLDQTRFVEFIAILRKLSPHPTEPLVPGLPTRTAFDVRIMPTLQFSYGDVPITLCSSGVQHIIALAYLLVWAWGEHVETSRRRRKAPQRNITLLLDEIEAHLHPAWQRTILPSLLDVVQILSKETQTQILIATHSPLVLASIESLFDETRDALFHLYIKPKDGQVQLDKVPFIKKGRVDRWLMSEEFGLKHPRSMEAEKAIEDAKALQLQRTPKQQDVQEVSDRLVNVLAQDDDFWPRWTYFAEQQGAIL